MVNSKDNPPKEICGLLNEYLYKAWQKGWFEEYSNEHFIMKALNGELGAFSGYVNMLEISSGFLRHDLTTTQSSFYQALSFSLDLLEQKFSEREIKNFIIQKLSAGKANYDEDQFLRALSELTVIKWFCLYTRGNNKNKAIYEPCLSERRNPEARFIRDDVIIDVEVKTPGFIPISNVKPKITPIVLLNKEGRKELAKKCIVDDIELRLPDINKLKQHLNDAARKFVVPTNDKHFNVVYMNWTFCDYPRYAFLEPYSLLMNDNGVLRNKEIGKAIGFDEDVYKKITAVVAYNENIEGFVNQDLRHIWSHRTFALAVNPYINCDTAVLENTLQMEQKRNIFPIPIALYDYYAKGNATEKDMETFRKLMQDYNEQIKKYALD